MTAQEAGKLAELIHDQVEPVADHSRWTEDKLLTAMADVEDRLLRGQRMLSQRVERIERSKHSDFSEIGDQVTSLATSLLIGYAIFVVMRAVLTCVQQPQQ